MITQSIVYRFIHTRDNGDYPIVCHSCEIDELMISDVLPGMHGTLNEWVLVLVQVLCVRDSHL